VYVYVYAAVKTEFWTNFGNFVLLTISGNDGAHSDVCSKQLLTSPRTISFDKMCVNSCLVTTAYVLLLLAVLASALSYVAPFWILFPSGFPKTVGSFSLGEFSFYKTSVGDLRRFWVAGLWASCTGRDDESHCAWFWENEFYAEKHLPGQCGSYRNYCDLT